jgi:ketosteroid isomerase-like protein
MAVASNSAEATLIAIAEAYTRKDVEGVLSHFAEDVRVIGSLRHEDWSRRDDVREPLRQELADFEDLEQTFIQGPEGAFEFVVDTNSVKFTTLYGRLSGTFRGRPFSHDGRWICVLRYDDGEGWRVVQSVFALTLA